MDIRYAIEADYDCIETLASQGQYCHVILRPDIYLEATKQAPVLSKDHYNEIIHNKNMIVCIDKDQILAYMAFEDKLVMNPLMRKYKTLFINSLSVDDNYKHRGISKMLMSWLKHYAKDHKYEKIELQVNDRNEIAKQLYIAQGFTNKSINMEYFLDL